MPAPRPDRRPLAPPSAAPPALGVNIDHVATLREARKTRYPDPVHAAYIAEAAGAEVVTFHLREDRRHIQPRDVAMIISAVSCRANLEMAATTAMLELAVEAGPDDCCLVPENRMELTTEGGLDVAAQTKAITDAVAKLSTAGIRVSLFIDPQPRQIDAALACGAPAVELHTGVYAEARGAARAEELRRIREAAAYAARRGLIVNAGHGLDYPNVMPVAAIEHIVELNIGHAIVSRAVFTGLDAAVREMLRLLREARR